jgi:hypothetical protein
LPVRRYSNTNADMWNTLGDTASRLDRLCSHLLGVGRIVDGKHSWPETCVLAATSCCQLCLQLFSLTAYITWVPLLNTCLPLKISPFFIPSWAVPLAYELFLLAILIWNAIDRPRQSHVTLVRSLQQDGIVFMLVRGHSHYVLALVRSYLLQVMVCLRCAQVGIAASLDPAKFLIIFLLVLFFGSGRALSDVLTPVPYGLSLS